MPRIFLYKEIIAVLSENDNRWMTYAELADSVNKRGNYQRTSRAKTVDREPKHIRVRVRKHPYSRHFEIDGNKVRLSKYGIVTASNALAGDQYNMLKGSQSANVCIRENESGISRLLEIMRRLRDPNTGCPWDIEQDFKSIAHHAIEEAYEVCDAIERGEWNELKDELGDLLFQTVFHAQMAEEKELFSFNDIANAIADKMVKRHPHVFGDESREKSAERQMRDWESAKASERQSNARTGALDDVAIALPSLLRAIKLQKRAARVGFDWPCAKNVVNKISEEAEELLAEIDADEDGRVEEELGDLLFSIANFARHLNIDPEQALRRANSKFESRFKRMENIVQDLGMNIEDATLGELDELWNRAKKDEKRRPKNP